MKLGLEVPADATVYREELYLRIREQNRMAMNVSHADLIAATNIWNKK